MPFPQRPPVCSPSATSLCTHTPLLWCPGGSRTLASSARMSSKVPPRGTEAFPLFLTGGAFLPAWLPKPSSKLVAAPAVASGRLSLKKEKNQKKLQRLLHPPPLPWAELHPSGYGPVAGSRAAAIHSAFTNNSHVTLSILSGPPCHRLLSEGFR